MKLFNSASFTYRVILGGCFVTVFFFMQTIASAEVLEIQYTGLDIVYDGTTISSAANPDPLQSLDFILDGNIALGLDAPGDSPLSIALSVPGVSNIPAAGGTVMSAAGGSLSLALPDGDFVNLELGPASITYVSIDALNIYFLLGGGSAEVLGQLLPIDGELADVVAVSFSTNIKASSKTESGGYLTGFRANGTGEIEGDYVPEPGSITLLLCGLTSLLCWRRRV